MQVGAATARIMANSPWRVALMASSSWSHSFLTEKNWQLWPDVAADRRLYDALESGDYATWHGCSTNQILLTHFPQLIFTDRCGLLRHRSRPA
jgi:hypothetical protein